MKTYKGIDLFAGIGGIRLGFDKAFGDSIQTVFASEWDEKAQKTYKSNFSKDEIEIAGDITQIDEKDIPSFDICMAGFPCQPFSVGGKREGFDDDYYGICRGTLFLDVARICDYHKPKVIFCENVKGLATHDKKRTFQIIKKTFEDIGYKVFYKVLNSKDFGVPQRRDRIYIVCFRNDITPESFDFPVGCGKPVAIKDILEELIHPGKDMREDINAPVFRSDILELKDLKPGMKLSGTVRNVTSFGAFVDIGLHDDGFIHISKMSKNFVSNPNEILSAGDVIDCNVLEVIESKNKVALTLIKE
jgi:DNA (cytosine-5)-methyltransferase 1